MDVGPRRLRVIGLPITIAGRLDGEPPESHERESGEGHDETEMVAPEYKQCRNDHDKVRDGGGRTQCRVGRIKQQGRSGPECQYESDDERNGKHDATQPGQMAVLSTADSSVIVLKQIGERRGERREKMMGRRFGGANRRFFRTCYSHMYNF